MTNAAVIEMREPTAPMTGPPAICPPALHRLCIESTVARTRGWMFAVSQAWYSGSATLPRADCVRSIATATGNPLASANTRIAATWMTSAIALLAVGTVAFMGLGIASAVFPMLWTEKGLQMAYIVQAIVLLVSGVYYPTSVLPAWLQPLSVISPATYVIEGMRRALLDGADLGSEWPFVWPALLVGALSIPLGLRAFIAAERYAKRTGRLKRSG